MRSKILKLIAVLAMCFMVVGALVACGEAGPAGPTGPKGDKGDTGAAGNGIVSIDLSTDGTKLVIKYTNCTTAEVAIPSASDVPEASARIINDLCEPFDDFGGAEGLEDYFNTNVFFDPIDTEIYFAIGENIRYTYWRSGVNLQTLFAEVAKRYDTASAVEILTGFEPQLQDFIDTLLKANFENYLYDHLYADND